MEEINIPLYRAKKINSDEYIIGHYIYDYQTKEHFIEVEPANYAHLIVISTLAIHLPNMIDSQGNKIFASLREDGKGGDLCETDNGDRIGVFIWHKYAMCIDLKCIRIVDWKSEFKELRPQEYKARTKVIGIKGEYND